MQAANGDEEPKTPPDVHKSLMFTLCFNELLTLDFPRIA